MNPDIAIARAMWSDRTLVPVDIHPRCKCSDAGIKAGVLAGLFSVMDRFKEEAAHLARVLDRRLSRQRRKVGRRQRHHVRSVR